MAPAPSCLEGQGRNLLKSLVRSQRESASSVLVSLVEVSEEVVAKMSKGRGIFGEEGRMTLGTSFEQGEEVGVTTFRLAWMSRMMVSETSSASDLSYIYSPTDMKWFDNNHAKGLPTSFIECPRYPNPVPLRSSGVSSTSVIPCS